MDRDVTRQALRVAFNRAIDFAIATNKVLTY